MYIYCKSDENSVRVGVYVDNLGDKKSTWNFGGKIHRKTAT
jgi:hypothetical protein